jgi:hypothetical protein
MWRRIFHQAHEWQAGGAGLPEAISSWRLKCFLNTHARSSWAKPNKEENAMKMWSTAKHFFVAMVTLALMATGCGGTGGESESAAPAPAPAEAPAESHDGHDHDTLDDGHGHHHDAPRGGTLIVLGDHLGHFEALLDAETGTLSLYALDGHAEEPVRLTLEALTVEITPRATSETFTLELGAVASPLTGETVGDTSEFRVTDPRLQGLTAFDGVLGALPFRGTGVPPVEFTFPEGNE